MMKLHLAALATAAFAMVSADRAAPSFLRRQLSGKAEDSCPAADLLGGGPSGIRCCAGKYENGVGACDTSSCVTNFNAKNLNCHNYGSPQNPAPAADTGTAPVDAKGGGKPKRQLASGGSELCPYTAEDKAICDTSYFTARNGENCRNSGTNHCLGKVKCQTSGVTVPKNGNSDGTAGGGGACASTDYPAGTYCFYNGNSENFKVCEASPPTSAPTKPPTNAPTKGPTSAPTKGPTSVPTKGPTSSPTKEPTSTPTKGPTSPPTKGPSAAPSKAPTVAPTKGPTAGPTMAPTAAPTKGPTDAPTKGPTGPPTEAPSGGPTKGPTVTPTKGPTEAPSKGPTAPPTVTPTDGPTKGPTATPTKGPSASPTMGPTAPPTKGPTGGPTKAPTVAPTNGPTDAPSKGPTGPPTAAPTNGPTKSPTGPPTGLPTSTTPPTKAPVTPPKDTTLAPTPKLTGRPTTPKTSGDPHFTMFSGRKFDFHGGCDLVFLNNPDYNNGQGMRIHIRTKIVKWWSYVQSAVVQIGNDTFEVKGGIETRQYWVSGKEGPHLQLSHVQPFTIGGHKVRFRVKQDNQIQFKIFLEDGAEILLRSLKDFMSVDIQNHNEKIFGNSTGLLGSYHGGLMLARDGVTVLDDPNEFGIEWQVRSSEPMLFHSVEGTQHPQQCEMPSTTASTARRLGELTISSEAAAKACLFAEPADLEDCISDVMATGDIALAGAYSDFE